MKQPQEIEYKGSKYVVKYKHIQEDGIYQGEFSDRKTRGYTEAFIQPDGEEEIGIRSFCNTRDQYNKQVGRIISTTRLKIFVEEIEKGAEVIPQEYYIKVE